MSLLGFVDSFFCFLETNLNCLVTIFLCGSNLCNLHRAGLNQRNRNNLLFWGENLCHANLCTEKEFHIITNEKPGRCGPGGPVTLTLIPTLEHALKRLTLYLDIHSRWHVETHEGVNKLWIGIKDIDEPLVRPHLELLARIFVHK